ncbi:retinol-binding protein pinta-like [Maniola hyperantus]|uniref:retinol-binding protein pinta-like n=1 Tax=Aphantopus hyperantus TaxID=2795564 RepID=UPI00156A60BA|nr:retinol-binding protein pinta-like [Maniola hyperantus]
MTSIRNLCPSLEMKAQKELNEVPSTVSSDIQALRDWLKKQPHLKSVNPSNQWLIGFLRGNKFSLERSKEKLEMYYTLRTVLPEIYQNRDPFDPKIQEILQMGHYLPSKTTETDDACRICVARFKNTSTKHLNILDVIKVCFMINEIMILEDDNYTIAGLNTLVDLEGTGINLLLQWTPAIAKKVVTVVETAYPLRFKGCHILHTPPGFEVAYSILKTFLSEKLKQRLFVYTQMNESMYNVFSRKVLPQEYGGENDTIQELIDHWKAKVESYREWFLIEDEQRSDETLRLGEPKTSSSLFGVEGSFRKLEVD